MRILLVAGSFDSLTQRVLAELSDRGHAVAVEVAPDGSAVREAVTVTRPIWSWTAEEARPARGGAVRRHAFPQVRSCGVRPARGVAVTATRARTPTVHVHGVR
ncbi:hypothetical protein ACFWWN_31660 [Streptomyces sp. NPDC059082]|uniref:hypothetical protein n=1 Tax=Streptomyces sp. NPDC059082 TaxID=3346720 RepID=UPI0036D02FFE